MQLVTTQSCSKTQIQEHLENRLFRGEVREYFKAIEEMKSEFTQKKRSGRISSLY